MVTKKIKNIIMLEESMMYSTVGKHLTLVTLAAVWVATRSADASSGLSSQYIVPLLRDHLLVLGNGGLKREVVLHQGDHIMPS